MRIKGIYDNGGKTADRYTVMFDEIDHYVGGTPMYLCLGLSSNPDSPMGYSQWCTGMPGKHLGKKVTLKSLPKKIQDHIERRRA